MCSKEIGTHAHTMLAILDLNRCHDGDLYDHSMNTRIFTLSTNEVSYELRQL